MFPIELLDMSIFKTYKTDLNTTVLTARAFGIEYKLYCCKDTEEVYLVDDEGYSHNHVVGGKEFHKCEAVINGRVDEIDKEEQWILEKLKAEYPSPHSNN